MTTSDSYDFLIWKHLDDELSVAEAAEFESALLGSSKFKQRLTEATELDSRLGEAFADPTLFGPDLQLKIIDSVAAKQQSSFQKTRKQPWYQMVAGLAAVILLILAAQIQSRRRPQERVAPLLAAHVQSQGIQVLRSGRWLKVQAGEAIYFNETVQNLSREPVVFALHQGHRVTLRADSTMTLKQQGKAGTVVDLTSKLGGEVFCQVKRGQGRFKVLGHHVNVTVLGTKFHVRSFVNESVVSVMTGRVRVSSRGVNEKSLLLTSRGLIRAKNNQIVENALCEPEQLISWTKKPNAKAVEAVIKERPAESRKAASQEQQSKASQSRANGPMQPPESRRNPGNAYDLDNPVEPPQRNGAAKSGQ